MIDRQQHEITTLMLFGAESDPQFVANLYKTFHNAGLAASKGPTPHRRRC